jgi:hypothetical protein
MNRDRSKYRCIRMLIKHGIHKGPYLQRGRGIGSLLSSLFRSVVPALKTVGAKVLKSGLVRDVGKSLADSAVRSGLQLATTALDGGSMKGSLGSSITDAKRAVSQVIKERQLDSSAGNSSSSNGRKRVAPKRLSRANPSTKRRRKKKRIAVWEDVNSDEDFDEDAGETIEAEYADSD